MAPYVELHQLQICVPILYLRILILDHVEITLCYTPDTPTIDIEVSGQLLHEDHLIIFRQAQVTFAKFCHELEEFDYRDGYSQNI